MAKTSTTGSVLNQSWPAALCSGAAIALAEVLHVERVGDAQGEAVADEAHLFVIGLRDDVGQGGDEDGVGRRSLSTAPRVRPTMPGHADTLWLMSG